jgi:hypothetical protein
MGRNASRHERIFARGRGSARVLALAAIGVVLPRTTAQDGAAAPAPALEFPGLLARAAREAGNPLATYAAMLELEPSYRASATFSGIYAEVRLNYEEFLGVPFAGEDAMALPALRVASPLADASIPDGFTPRDAVSVIAEAAPRTRLVIFGEEHHLPQTRSLYEALLRRLWDEGYRYLAAEAFDDAVMEPGWGGPDFRSGYYLMDPVYASAVRVARQLGYTLVAYDTSERSPPGDGSLRDRRQAENLVARVFDRDPAARLLVLAGRGHAAEVPPADGWTPMASVLARLTGIDPFTIYAPTMSERRTAAEEDPLYRDATARGLVSEPVIFVNGSGAPLGSGHCDAYLFWPRVGLVDGRPDWLVRTLRRTSVPMPAALVEGSNLRLVQAFLPSDPDDAVPIDQVLLRPGEPAPTLMLPAGSFRVRSIDAEGRVRGPVETSVAERPAPATDRPEAPAAGH